MRRLVVAIAVLAASMSVSSMSASSMSLATGTVSDAPRQIEDEATMQLVDQTYGVRDNTDAIFQYTLDFDIPEITNPTTTTTTTTTSTTTTTTTTPTRSTPASNSAATPSPATTTSPTPTTAPPPPAPVNVHVIAYEPIANPAAVDAALDGSLGTEIDSFIVPANKSVKLVDSSLVLDLAVPIAGSDQPAEQLNLTKPGLYPIQVMIQRGDEQLGQHVTFVERVPDDEQLGRGPMTLTILAATDDLHAASTDADVERVQRQAEAIIDLATLIAAPISVRISPEAAGALTTEQLNKLADLLVDDVVLPSGVLVIDPDAAVFADAEELYLSDRQAGSERLRTLFPQATVSSEVELLRDDLTEQGARLLAEQGIELLVSSRDLGLVVGNTASDTGNQTEIERSLQVSGVIDDETVFAVELVDPVMALLEPVASNVSGLTPAERAVALVSTISASRQQLPPDIRTLILATPDIGVPDAAVLEFVERFVNQHPELSLNTLDSTIGTTNANFIDGQPVVVKWDTDRDIRLATRQPTTQYLRGRANSAASMLPQSPQQPADWRKRLQRAQSTLLSQQQAQSLLAGVEADIDEVLEAVQQPEPFAFTQTGNDSPLRLRLVNRSSTAVNVIVSLSSERLVSTNGPVETVLSPNAVTDVPIDVTVRSNGQTPVELTITAPDGTPLIDPVVLSARVTTFSGLGRLISVGALLVLATWWMAYLFRRRGSPSTADRRNRPTADAVDTGHRPNTQ